MKKNKYDYKKMMDDFDLETRRKKMFNGIRSKWQSISKGYLEKIEEMKLKNEKLYKERNRKFKQKIKKKELAIKNQMELKNQRLQEKKKEQEEYSKKKMDDVLKNLEEYNKSEEEKRLKLEQETFEKSNKYFYYNFFINIVRGIQERYNRFRENQKKNLNNKLETERQKYAISKERHLQDVQIEQELQQAKAFKKYEGYVSNF